MVVGILVIDPDTTGKAFLAGLELCRRDKSRLSIPYPVFDRFGLVGDDVE